MTYHYDVDLRGVTRIFQHDHENPPQTTSKLLNKAPESTNEVPQRAHTVDGFGWLILSYGSEEKDAPDFDTLKKIIRSFKKDLGQFLGVQEEGKQELADRKSTRLNSSH